MKRSAFIFLLLVAAPSRAQYVGGIGGGGDYTCASGVQVLPVELLHFTAMPNGDQVQLQWATASELNNAGFHVERSADGARFDAIAEVEGMGTTPLLTNYEAVDRTPLPGLSYYRLRQTDLDGTATWSDAVPVQMSATRVVAFPNPVRTVLTIQGVAAEGTRTVEVFDSRGRSALQRTLPEGAIQMDMAALPAGLYRVRVSSTQGTGTLSVVKE